MSDSSNNIKDTMCYPTKEQRERWDERADELDMNTSEFVKSMVEAGMKKFEVSVEPDESAEQLREERNQLRDELEQAEDALRSQGFGEADSVQEYIEENPGATFGEILNHMTDTMPGRLNRLLDELDGYALRREGDEYYPPHTAGNLLEGYEQ